MTDLDLKMSIKAEDQASRALAQVSQAVKKTGQIAEQAARTTSSATQRMAQTRANLGIRSEKEIQREIQRTIASYNRLTRSGTASAREIARAQEAARNKVRELNAEMGKTSTGQRLANAGRNVMGAVAGVTAGAMVMREPVRKSLGYDRELAMVANTAFSDRNAEGRIAGKKELHEAVKNAVATSGGTKEEALASINALLASGMDAKTAMSLLPTLQKGAVATGASAEELSAIAISALQNGIAEADIGKALDMAVAAGQAGQFELRDMAKWLPQQMAKASAMGLSGLEGFQTLLVANQQSRVTAGTNDEAGNNLSNLLGKITAKETADRFSKIAYKDEKGKVREINYLKSMEAYKAQGKNSLEAFMAILDKVVGNNDDYKALQEKLKRANGKEEQAKLLAEMAKLIEGSAIAEIVSDQQALMALLGIRNNVQLGKTVNEQVENSQGAVDTSHKVIAETNDFKIDKAKSLAEFRQMEGLQGFNNLLGSASETLTDYMNEYPGLTAAVAGAGTGIAALGAAAFAAAGSISLLGGDKGSLGDLFGSSRGKTPMASGGKLGTALKWGSRAVGVVGVATMLSGDESEETKRLKAQHST
ncbi:phage tail tape measure protein, partial [Actinobacillus minor]|uniref:phage tail tape measure protein n=1 Tax=Actinobacillus minor TaxID=51047 RepID=UPI0023F554D5